MIKNIKTKNLFKIRRVYADLKTKEVVVEYYNDECKDMTWRTCRMNIEDFGIESMFDTIDVVINKSKYLFDEENEYFIKKESIKYEK